MCTTYLSGRHRDTLAKLRNLNVFERNLLHRNRAIRQPIDQLHIQLWNIRRKLGKKFWRHFSFLTFIDKWVSSLEQIRSCFIFAGVKWKRDGTIKRDSTTGRDRPTITTAKWRIYELGGIWRLHLRINIHVLDATSGRIMFDVLKCRRLP